MELLFLTLFCFLITHAAEATNYKITKLDRSPGIYFERLPDIRYLQTSWKIISFINLDHLNFNSTYLHTTINRTQNYCHKEDDKQAWMCKVLTQRLDYARTRINTLTRIYDGFKDTMREVEPVRPTDVAPPSAIKKRSAAFGFIGSVSRALFGTLTEEDGKYYDQQIADIFKG